MLRDATTTEPKLRRGGSSLERKLPVFISGLLLLVVGVYGWASYREVRQSTLEAARERLRGTALQLADISATATARGEQTLRGVAAQPAVMAVARGGGSVDSAAAVLRRSQTGADSTLMGWELWTATGVRRLALGEVASRRDTEELRHATTAAVTATVPDSARRSPFYAQGGRVFAWTVVPVRAGERTIGFLAQRRRLADNPGSERQIRALTGQDVWLLLANADGSLWTSLRGRPVPAMSGVHAVSSDVEATTVGAERVLATGAAIRGTPWSVVLVTPEHAVLGRPRALLRRMLAIGALLLVAGALAAWALSRHVTRPLRTVTDAAEALAAGDYERRVSIRRHDELGRLGATFNAMAQRIGDSHAELARRVEETSSLAGTLELRNAALRVAQDETLRAIRRTERLQAVTAALAGALDYDAVASVIVKEGLESVEAHAGSVYLTTVDQGGLELLRAEGYDAELVSRFERIPLDAPMPLSDAARTGEPVFIGTPQEARLRYGDRLARPGSASQAWAALPLVVRERIVGVMGLSFAQPRPFDRETRAFLLALAQQCAQALDRASLFDAAVYARNAAEEARHIAQAANEAKSAFLAMMSHELRTPLNAIGGYADLMEMGLRGPVTAQQADDLARIRRNQQHLLSIINDILNLSRIEAGQLALHLADVAPDEVLAEVEALIAPQVAAKGLRYELTPCGPGVTARADREKLQQVLLNLVSNAVRFTDVGGAVAVDCEPVGDTVVFRVRDTGIGIPGDKLEAIFEPFVQVDSGLTRRSGGTGLGLAISRDLATAMDGRIDVESKLGRGSVFSLVLPRGSAPRAAAERGEERAGSSRA